MVLISNRPFQRLPFNPLYDDDISVDAVTPNEVLRNEDVFILGSITSLRTPVNNSLWGTQANLEGDKNFRETSRGNKADIMVSRQRELFVERKGDMFKWK